MGEPGVPEPKRRPVFATALLLAAFLLGVKILELALWGRGVRASAADALVVLHEDLGFALASGVAAFVVLGLTRRWPRIERVAWAAWLSYGAIAVAYAVFSYRVYAFIYAPLTYRLVSMGGGVSIAWSSLRLWLTPGFVAVLVGAPVAHVAVSRAAAKLRPPRSIVVPAVQALVAALALHATMEGSYEYAKS